MDKETINKAKESFDENSTAFKQALYIAYKEGFIDGSESAKSQIGYQYAIDDSESRTQLYWNRSQTKRIIDNG